MCLAESYRDEIIACNDCLENIMPIHIAYTDDGRITKLVLKPIPRNFNIYFNDGSWIEKIYLGNERSTLDVYEH